MGYLFNSDTETKSVIWFTFSVFKLNHRKYAQKFVRSMISAAICGQEKH